MFVFLFLISLILAVNTSDLGLNLLFGKLMSTSLCCFAFFTLYLETLFTMLSISMLFFFLLSNRSSGTNICFSFLLTTIVLVRVSVAGKRQHDHNSSYKGNLLIEAGLQLRFSLLSSWQEALGLTDMVLAQESRFLDQDGKTAILEM